MRSVWQSEVDKPDFPTLKGNASTDVLIIGGGMAGILCGHMLKRAGVDCVIVEARGICDGATKNTTAKITAHHGAIFHDMIRRYGDERAALYVKAHTGAIKQYADMARTVDCDYKETDSFV